MKSVLTGIAVVIAVAAISVGGYFAYWFLAKDTTARRYDVNTGTQQYQSSLIAQERNLVSGWNTSDDPGQKQTIADQFCAIYLNLTPPTADLSAAHARIC